MIFLKLNGLLYILVMAMAVSTNENVRVKWRDAFNYRSSNCLVPFHYNLKMTMTDWSDHISGEFNATIYINCAIQNIILRSSKDISIIKVKLKSANNGIDYTTNGIFNGDEYVVINFFDQFLPENNLLLECGVYTLYVKFLNSIPHHSRELLRTWYTNEKGHEKLMVATVIQPRRARQLFPCWDEPELTATFNISVEHHKKSKVLSNMPIREYQPVDDDTIHTLFYTTPQMSTNDVAFIMYDVDEMYEVLNSTETVVNMWCKPHLIPYMKFAQYVAGNVTDYLQYNWKHVKGVAKVDYVAIPKFEDKIWQTWGLIFYNEADIIYNEELHPPAFKTILMRSIAHEITYQWFHNSNFFHPSWSPLWLNEGFIMFLGTDIIDKAFPDSRIMDLFVVQVQHESCRLNTHCAINYFMEYTSNIPNINSLSPLSQIGAVIWRMLASVIGNSFWLGIDLYLISRFTHFTSKTPDDLWNDMQTAINYVHKHQQNCNLNVKEMMHIWTIQQYCPVLNVIRDYSSGRVKISKEFHEKLDWKPYFIPVTYTNETNINFSITPPHWIIDYCLTQSNPEIEIQFNDKDKWIIFNIQQTGYYRVNYDSENWRIIARYLNSEKYTNIHVLNRAQIIDDAFHLAIEKKLNFSIFWELVKYLPREKDYVAWYPMIKAFEYISNIFAFSKEPQDKLPNVIKDVLVKIRSIFEHIEEHMYEIVPTDDDFNKYLKQELAKWGCIIDNALCLRKAKQQLNFHSINPKTFKILPGWHKWTYCNSIKTMDHVQWLDVLHAISAIYKEKSDHKMLEFLSCSEDPQIIHRFLRYILPAYEKDLLKDEKEKQTSTQRKKRFRSIAVNIYLSILTTHTKNIAMLKEILKNFKDINDSGVSMNAALNVMINNAYSKEQLNEIYKFAENYMQQTLSNIEHKVRTRSLEVRNQLNFLENLFEKPNNMATSIVGGATTPRTPTITSRYKRPN